MFILLPILEIYVLIVIGGSIGPFNSILLILLTAIFGVYLLRNQGLKKIFEIRSNKEVPSPTTDNILKTLFTPIGGLFLLIPGFVTDLFGLLILMPVTRILILGLIFSNLKPLSAKNNVNNRTGDWIEGEYKKDK